MDPWTFDFEAACGEFTFARDIECAIMFTRDMLGEEREEALKDPSRASEVEAKTQMIGVLECAMGRVYLTFGDQQLEQLHNRAHAEVGAIMRAYKAHKAQEEELARQAQETHHAALSQQAQQQQTHARHSRYQATVEDAPPDDQ